MWDLERENCIAQLNLPPPPSTSGSGSNSGGEGATVEHLAASGTSPLLYAADATGTGDFRVAACLPVCLMSCILPV